MTIPTTITATPLHVNHVNHVHSPQSVARLAPALVLTGLLAACGGGGGSAADAPVTGTDVPVKATSLASEATAFVQTTLGTTSESAEPLLLGDVTLATSETDEPSEV